MKIDKEFLNKIYYNGDLNIKQLDILNIDFSSEKNYENEILGKEISKNEDNNITTSNNILKIYCDGACSGNPENAGSGIAVYFDDKNPVLLYCISTWAYSWKKMVGVKKVER
ncbi:hypothetical protein Q6A87_03635 [Aliarcobacter skirrowii]|uniref:hypothetical protein n=1 Tax=Aliarcobacter skirrowii TaxID=28200 RepID=UPI0029B846DC|nr:hypothetical protein [Aliarcobacter skirrowii]MDX4066938.1 hypothetical protein [Aliarcobacter skirrowii]